MDGKVRLIREGKVLGEASLSAPALAGPAVRDGFLFVASEKGAALAATFDGGELRPLWEVELPAGKGGALRIIAPIAIVGSTVVAATEGGAVHLLER
jgi:outer membrane protein assembly factor BamB